MSKLIKAIYGTPEKPLVIGEFEIQCYVLENEKRVLVQKGLTKALGMSTGGGTGGVQRIVQFVNSKSISPFISSELRERMESPIKFKLQSGGEAYGYEAEILVDLCDAVIESRKQGKLHKYQEHIAERAEILIRGFAKVGIIALIDEVTGYQDVRDKNALYKILEAYINPTLLPWTKRFPDEFYKEMFRLNGWNYNPLSVKRPSVIGTWTNKLIYEQLPDGVLEELKKKTPKKVHLHRSLTEDVGHPHLSNQLAAVTAIVRLTPNWRKFLSNFAKAFRVGQQELDLDESES